MHDHRAKWAQMMNKNFLAAVAAGTLLLGANAASAAVQVFDFTVYQAGFNGALGSVTVTDHGTNTLDFDVVLANDVFFQLTNGNLHDAFWFDLPGLGANKSVSYNISAPNAPGGPSGDYPTGGLFKGGNYDNNGYGQGFLSGFDYAMQVQDPQAPKQYYGDGGHLTFSITGATPLSIASLGAGQTETVGGQNYHVVFGADLRQCAAQVCVTGPVGAVARTIPAGVPEPTAWALMIMGFGAIGAVLRRRRDQLVHA
jgi:hypothetical protein